MAGMGLTPLVGERLDVSLFEQEFYLTFAANAMFMIAEGETEKLAHFVTREGEEPTEEELDAEWVFIEKKDCGPAEGGRPWTDWKIKEKQNKGWRSWLPN